MQFGNLKIIIFHFLGNHEEHTKYCFDIYDLNGDGAISREEMLNMLKTSLGRQGLDDDPDEGVKDLIDMTLKKLDRDKDGKVSFKVIRRFILSYTSSSDISSKSYKDEMSSCPSKDELSNSKG